MVNPMQKGLWTLLMASCLLLSPVAHAKIYKCTTSTGKVNFKDSPCTSGKSEEISISNTNVMDKNDQAERYKSSAKPQTNIKNKSKSPSHVDPLKSQNEMMCKQAQSAYNQQVKEIKERCKKGRETFCNLPAEEIQRRWDRDYLKREGGDAFSPPTRQWQAFNNSGGAPIFNLKSQVDQYCEK